MQDEIGRIAVCQCLHQRVNINLADGTGQVILHVICVFHCGKMNCRIVVIQECSP